MSKRDGREPFDLESVTDLAVHEFLQRGYDATSMTDLARAAGITKSSFYYWVSGKEELLRRGIDRALSALFGVLEEPAAQQGSARSRLEHILTRAIEVELTLHAEVALLLRARGNTQTELDAIARRREFTGSLADLIAEGMQAGEFRSDLDAHDAARLVLGMETSVIEWGRALKGRSPETIAKSVCTLVFGGLTAG